MVALVWLDPGDPFPPTRNALDDPDGLLCAGADLSIDTLKRAYSRGIFPWYSDDQPILWWTPSPRMVLTPENFHASRSLRKHLRKNDWHISIDQHFAEVVSHCANTPRDGQPGTWITDEMQAAYLDFHQAGYAHSIEVLEGDQLVGGLYGVCLGQVFFGESMFSHADNASKTALWFLCALAAPRFDVRLVDCQMQTSHLATLGAEPMARGAFERQLDALQRQPNRGQWSAPSQDLASWLRQYRLEP
jgi:leucyl/phenylalanyl-tRNA--protein transferase